MRIVPKPDRSTPVLGPDGQHVSDAWDEYFTYLSALNLPAFARASPANAQFWVYSTTAGNWTLQPTVAPTNNQVLIYNSGSGTWVAGTN